MPACNLHKHVDTPAESITIANVDPVLLEQQRLALHVLVEKNSIEKFLLEPELSALIGVVNMLDFWSDERRRNNNFD